MEVKNYITAFCKINSGEVNVNHSIAFSDKTTPPADFIKTVYEHYQLNYPEFNNMDKPSQLAFVTSELLIKENKVSEKNNPENISIVIAKNVSSETDIESKKSIFMNEIAKRNNIKGENASFTFDKFDTHFMCKHIESLLNSNKATCCISGWIDFYENKYEAFLYTVEKTDTGLRIEHTADQLNNLYK